MPKHEVIEDALVKIFAGIKQLKEALLWLNDSGHPDRALSFAQQ